MLTKRDIQIVEEIVDRVVERKVDIITEEKISRHLGVFIEHMNDQFQRILEAIAAMEQKVQILPKHEQRLEVLEIKQRALEADARFYERRLAMLEASNSQ